MALNQLSIAAFKQAAQISKIDVLKNPKTDKWFAVADNGKAYRCHQATDWNAKPRNVVVLVEDGNLESACLCPAGLGAPVAASY